jgi:surfactin synthase thioesterase subunit
MGPAVVLIPPLCCGAGYFRRLRRALSDQADVRAVELPGHGRRFAEPFLTSAEDAVSDVLARIGGPVDAVYGESLGAYIGLAVAAALARGRAQERPPVLIAASNSPPSVQRRIAPGDVVTLESAVATLTSMGGVVPDEALADAAVAASAFPLIRADLLLSGSFVDGVRTARAPGEVHVLGGESDSSLTGLRGWARHSTGTCTVARLPGGHLLARDNPSGVAAALLRAVAGLPA